MYSNYQKEHTYRFNLLARIDVCIQITLRRDLRRANVISRQRIDISIQITTNLTDRIDICIQINSKDGHEYIGYSAQRLAQRKRRLPFLSRALFPALLLAFRPPSLYSPLVFFCGIFFDVTPHTLHFYTSKNPLKIVYVYGSYFKYQIVVTDYRVATAHRMP